MLQFRSFELTKTWAITVPILLDSPYPYVDFAHPAGNLARNAPGRWKNPVSIRQAAQAYQSNTSGPQARLPDALGESSSYQLLRASAALQGHHCQCIGHLLVAASHNAREPSTRSSTHTSVPSTKHTTAPDAQLSSEKSPSASHLRTAANVCEQAFSVSTFERFCQAVQAHPRFNLNYLLGHLRGPSPIRRGVWWGLCRFRKLSVELSVMFFVIT